MKNIQKYQFGESRLVWENKPPQGAPQSSATEAQKAKVETATVAPNLTVGLAPSPDAVKVDVEKILDKPVDLNKMRGDENHAMGVVSELAEKWTGPFDQLSASVGLMLGRSVSKNLIESAVHLEVVEREIQEEKEEIEHPTPPVVLPSTTEEKVEVTQKSFNKAEHVIHVLDTHPTWKNFLNQSAARWKLDPSILGAFTEMESSWNPNDTPVYINLATGKKDHAKDAKGNPEKLILSKEEQARRGIKLSSSAHGLAQVMQYDEPRYLAERYDSFAKERAVLGGSVTPLPAKGDKYLFYNAEVSLDFMAWHLNNKIAEVDAEIFRSGLPDAYRIDGSEANMRWLYLSYNSGAHGYLMMRQYMDNPTQENKDKLVWFQKRTTKKADGTVELDGLHRFNYAKRVAQTTRALSILLNRNVNISPS